MLLPQNVPKLLAASPDLEYLYKIISEAPLDTQPAQGVAPDPPSPCIPDPSNSPPEISVASDNITGLCVVCSALTSAPLPPPPPQVITPPPRNWHKVPQEAYDHGRKQWNFAPLECISFRVDGFPGVNMGDAFRKRFPGLLGRDDLVLQDAPSVVSCRLSVILFQTLCIK